jgi:hypothetical protein
MGEVVVEERLEVGVVSKTIIVLYLYTNSVASWLTTKTFCRSTRPFVPEEHTGYHVYCSKYSDWCPSCCPYVWLWSRKLPTRKTGNLDD